MNTIKLKGYVKNIQYSHSIKDIEYYKANLISKRPNGSEDVIPIKFKRFCNKYKEDDFVELVGNIRSYSEQRDGGNKVKIYVFTYQDLPEYEEDSDTLNEFEVDGRICKMDELRKTANGRSNIHFILANNLMVANGTQKLNAYLPCIAWGRDAVELSKLSVNSKLLIKGELHSREYTKMLDNGEAEIRVAHELLVKSYEVIE